jgi:putative sugar O-methyltransferase
MNSLIESRKFLSDITSDPSWQAYERALPRSPIWSGENAEVMRSILANSASSADAVSRLQAFWFQQIPPRKIAELAVDWHLRLLNGKGASLDNLPSYVEETRFCPEGAVVIRQGRRLRSDLFRHLGTLLRLQECWKPEGSSRVLELGAGTGNFARLMLCAFSEIKYTIIDLPETLVFSYMHLRELFPDKEMTLIQNPDDIGRHESASVVFCPIHLAEYCVGPRYDLVVNAASLGEMKRETVRYWFDLIQTKFNPAYLISVNRYLNTLAPDFHEWRIEDNESCLHYDAAWTICDWELEPDFLRCPYNNKHARQALIIARRNDAAPVEMRRTEAAGLIDEVLSASWNEPPLEMSCQDNALVSDLSMKGLLFKAWEAIRIAPDKDTRRTALTVMMRYLETIIHKDDRHFEEFFQYGELLKKIITEGGPSSDEKSLIARSSIDLWKSLDASVELIESGNRGYNIIKFRGRYVALLQALGGLEYGVDLLTDRDLMPYVLVDSTLDALKNKMASLQ